MKNSVAWEGIEKSVLDPRKWTDLKFEPGWLDPKLELFITHEIPLTKFRTVWAGATPEPSPPGGYLKWA